MSKKQREVSERLGKNDIENHEKYYSFIEKKIGPTKKCNFGHIRGSKTGVKHEGCQDVPIRNFELKGCFIDQNDNVELKSKDGLQGFCKTCSKLRRQRRLEMSSQENKGPDTYIEKYGKNTKKCSMCKIEKNIQYFNPSLRMECGFHNQCIECSKSYGDSMGDRLIKYRPDGNYKYKKTEKDQHDDHIMPLAFGGTNKEVNHQLLPKKVNLSKSSEIPYDSILDIPENQICERWKHILAKAKEENISISEFKSRITKAIRDEQRCIYNMTDIEIKNIFKLYNKNNNRRINIERAVQKFKIYCKDILNLN